jgi:hypothetical protein
MNKWNAPSFTTTTYSPRQNFIMVNKLIAEIPSAKRSLLRQLEDLLPEIEEGLAKGYSHAAMHAALPALGINIGLPYYHRALNMLRRERREGKHRQIPPQTSGPERELPTPAPERSDMKAPVLPVAFVKTSLDAPSTINSESSGPKPFTWSGREFLEKDWSNF